MLLSMMLPSASAFCPNRCSGHGTCQSSPKDTCLCFTAKEIDVQWAATGLDVSTAPSQPSASTLDLNHYGSTEKTASGAIIGANVMEVEEEVTIVVKNDNTEFGTASFTLTFGGQTTASITDNSDASTIQTALEALSTINSGDIDVTQSTVSATDLTTVITFKNNAGNVGAMTMTLSGYTNVDPTISTQDGVKGADFLANGLGFDAVNGAVNDLTTHTAGMIDGTSSFEGELSLYLSDVPAWTGADCSLRTCPYGMAWAAAPKAANDHTTRLECSGVGSCDRKTGTCKCNPPYTGVGCRRTLCENDCSGHGSCKSQSEIANMASHDAEGDISKQFSTPGMSASQVDAYTGGKYDGAFDSEANYGCVCEGLYHGADCSLKSCPSAADPLSGKGAERGRPCSGRGTCDSETGLCKCHNGYYGTYCHIQSPIAQA